MSGQVEGGGGIISRIQAENTVNVMYTYVLCGGMEEGRWGEGIYKDAQNNAKMQLINVLKYTKGSHIVL